MIKIIKNEELEVRLNTFAGAIEGIRDLRSGTEHYWQYDEAVWPRRTSVCFPICGTMVDGKYTHQGKEYTMPMHGFLREKEMAVAACGEDSLTLAFESDDATRACYPFDFRFELEYHLEGAALEITYRVLNTGEKEMFFSVGSHYTYALPAAQKDCQFYFSKGLHAGKLVLENGVVTGKTADVMEGADRLSMENLFETGSTIFELEDIKTDYIGLGTKDELFTKVEAEGFPYIVLWAPAGGDSSFACIEYWAGMVDYAGHDGELAKKQGIMALAPGESRRFVQRVVMDRNGKL